MLLQMCKAYRNMIYFCKVLYLADSSQASTETESYHLKLFKQMFFIAMHCRKLQGRYCHNYLLAK